MIRTVDCQGLGGGMTYGFARAGHTFLRKVEQRGDFGFTQCDANRHLIGDTWDYFAGDEPEWPAIKADVVMGNPPCSGFSMMSVRAGSGVSRTDKRGPNAAINSCMWDLVKYASRCEAEFVVMESVQTAGKDSAKGGRVLMRQLRDYMVELTGKHYDLYHCFHNGAALGASSVRRRYFMVLSRRPFGVNIPKVPAVPWLTDVLADIDFVDTTQAGSLPYTNPSTWWSHAKRNVNDQCDGNTTWLDLWPTNHGNRLQTILDVGWPEGAQLTEILGKYVKDHDGEWPDSEVWNLKAQQAIYHRPLKKAVDYDAVQAGTMTEEEYLTKWKAQALPKSRPVTFQGGAYQPRRWRSHHAGLVLAGNGMTDIIHPWVDRTLTYRECARIMGFPDSWDVKPYMENRGGGAVFGKGVLVESGEWIGRAVAAAFNDQPFEHQGELVGDGEYVINLSNIHRPIYNERTGERNPWPE